MNWLVYSFCILSDSSSEEDANFTFTIFQVSRGAANGHLADWHIRRIVMPRWSECLASEVTSCQVYFWEKREELRVVKAPQTSKVKAKCCDSAASRTGDAEWFVWSTDTNFVVFARVSHASHVIHTLSERLTIRISQRFTFFHTQMGLILRRPLLRTVHTEL